MAKLQLKFHDLSTEIGHATERATMTLSTEKESAVLFGYSYSLKSFSMKKQMYQPSEVTVDISIAKSTENDWQPINRYLIESIFKFRKVTLSLMSAKGNDVAEEIFNDFYIHEVISEYLTDGMNLRLKIYSLDKMLTLKQTSRSFVGKKLGDDILKKEVENYVLPYDSSEKLAYNTEFMKRLKFKSLAEEPIVSGILDKVKELTNPEKKEEKKEEEKKDEKKGPRMVEHIFPYLVQYNESLYDMLARTTNRWGEFMYYEDGKLQIGYNDDEKTIKEIKNYHKITYSNQDVSDKLLEKVTDGNYEAEAVYDKNIYDNPVQKSPRIVRAELGKFNGLGDKYAMKKIASFFNTDQNVVSWLVNTLVDDGVSVLQAMSRTKVENDGLDDKYFPGKGTVDQYGKYTFTLYDDEKEEKDGFNEFTEISTVYADTNEIYDAKRYGTIFDLEQSVGRDMVFIDFDTTWPGVKLGQIIKVNGELFIVVDISTAYKNDQLTFQVKASAPHHQYDDKEQKTHYEFYPAVIPSGHVRYSGPQMAKIKDASDPSYRNRVRVAFPWQGELKKVDKKDATPWIVFATKGDGKPTTGKHNEKDDVMVGFIDGNVERPYVMGAIQSKVPGNPNINVDFNTPGGHFMRLTDGTGLGLIKFVTSALSPLLETLVNFLPIDKLGSAADYFKEDAWSGNKYFEGGFELSDNYGIYKISGSTDQRKISVSSPWGDVKIDAFTGITISAPNGDVKITGKNVTIEAGNNLKLESGTNIGWKLGNDKKYGNFSAAALGLTVAGAIASKVAEKIKPLDLKVVRSVVEVVMRPVEGALTVKSNRFLKLEAGGNECQYPMSAYSDKKREELKKEMSKAMTKGVEDMGDGVVELFEKTRDLVGTMNSNWSRLYSDCLSKKEELEAAICVLDLWRNDDTQPSCKTYNELKETFWAAGDKEISEADLGFTDNVGDQVPLDYFSNHQAVENVDEVIDNRKRAKDHILTSANGLRKTIVKVMNFEMTEKDIDNAFGAFQYTPPKNYKKLVSDAISKSKCPEFLIYDPKLLGDNYKDLKPGVSVNADHIKACKRQACLNLVEGLKLDKCRANAANSQQPPEKPTFKNILKDADAWAPYVNSLTSASELKKKDKPSLGSVVGDPLKKAFTDIGKDVKGFKKAYQELFSWSDGNKGQILIGTDDNTYKVKGGNDNATIDQFETKYYLTVTDEANNNNPVKQFINKLKGVLIGI